ncbi:PhaM family polyhydroxyalkanoate granule multifunctional regulatory protein [Paraburkholderia sp. BCC1886]|uniref:PhaM family polyhydroxyalkanoate granule multifunctional regulatory protein n=1 Tax=Paraburkholderia sp. BCC1886 TaxID=2562670 RepID=UPI001182EFDC|nr:PhaM family polyhydroxyalkanoate granule multifunctional regulatory protein [Paraburkholderia sp. BCC1886]
MTDTSDSTPSFGGFPGFPPAEMLERMWGMMRMSPFGASFPGAQSGAGLSPSLSMMSDMMAPLTNVEELDKRITDMRAVEQWLKLNLSMLQSAIQALEVQRATLATLRAFGAFAQASMTQPATEAPAPSPAPFGWPHPQAPGSASASARTAPPADEPPAEQPAAAEDAPTAPPFDASAWWNVLQSQFNQIAQFAMTQPASAAGSTDTASDDPDTDAAASATGESTASGAPEQPARAAATTRRPAAKKTTAASKRTSTGTAPRSGKKSI